MWTEKHRPRRIEEVVGNKRAKRQFLAWVKKWRAGARAILLYGPPGVGKTALVHATARELNYDVIEMNASDVRTRDAIMKIVGQAAAGTSLLVASKEARGTLVLLDEVDGVFPGKGADAGGMEAINYVVSYARNPIVLIANCPWQDKLRPLRGVCEMIRFNRVSARDVVTLLERICQREGVDAEPDALKFIAEMCNGDARSAINDLQALAEGRTKLKVSDVLLAYRDRQRNVFETLRAFFSASSALEARKVLESSELNIDELMGCICDDIPLVMVDACSRASAYEVLAKADLMMARSERSRRWELLAHVANLLAQVPVVGVSKRGFVRFQPRPLRRLILARAKGKRALLQSICEKVKGYCHVSRKIANLDYMPMLKIIFRHDPTQAQAIARELRLTNDEVQFLTKFD